MQKRKKIISTKTPEEQKAEYEEKLKSLYNSFPESRKLSGNSKTRNRLSQILNFVNPTFIINIL